jgi:hypothetical protein
MSLVEGIIALVVGGMTLMVLIPVIGTVMQSVSDQQVQIADGFNWNTTDAPPSQSDPLSFVKEVQPYGIFLLLIGGALIFMLVAYPVLSRGSAGSDIQQPVIPQTINANSQQHQQIPASAQNTFSNPFAEEQQQLPENHYHNRFEAILDNEEELGE